MKSIELQVKLSQLILLVTHLIIIITLYVCTPNAEILFVLSNQLKKKKILSKIHSIVFVCVYIFVGKFIFFFLVHLYIVYTKLWGGAANKTI